MKCFKAYLIATILLTPLFLGLAVSSSAHPLAARSEITPATIADDNPFVRLKAAQPLPPGIEKMTGRAAMQYLESLNSRRQGVITKAKKRLEQRGYRPTDEVLVLRSRKEASSIGERQSSIDLVQQETFYDTSGEIVMWSWTDEDPSTWEGTIYLDEYSSTWIDVTAQFYVPVAEDGTILAFDETWSDIVDYHERPSEPLEPVYASNGSLVNAGHPGPIHLAGFWRVVEKWRDWATCTAFGCVGGAYVCNNLNPTPQEKPDVAICAGVTCAGSGIACLGELR